MNRHRLPLYPLALALLLAACAPASGDAEASPPGTQDELASMTEQPIPTDRASMSTAPSPTSSPHHTGGTTGPRQTVEVDIVNFAFEPVELTIQAGTEVVFTNSDAAPHTVTAGTAEAPMPELFDSGLLQTGDVFRFVFDEPGEFAYFCERHPPMTGTIVVED